MTQMSMTQSDADPCLFYRDHADGRRTFLLVYVDDFLLAAARQADIDELKAQIMEAFASKDIGPPTFFLGLHINHSRSTRELTVSQQQYVRALLERNGLTDANPVRLPMVVGVQLERAGEQLDMEGRELYQSLIGGLLYLATCTRPDISFAVGKLHATEQRRRSPTTRPPRRSCATSRGPSSGASATGPAAVWWGTATRTSQATWTPADRRRGTSLC